MNVWRLIAHHETREPAFNWMKQNQRIAIGWGDIGDIRQRNYQSAAEISAAIRRYYPGLRNSGNGGPSLWNLYSQVEKGDLVIISAHQSRRLVVQVLGDYEYQQEIPPFTGNYQHQRRMKVTTIDPAEIWRLAGGKMPGANVYLSLLPCRNAIDIQV